MDEGREAELIGRCLSGDAEAFTPLVDRYQRVLFNVALRMVGNAEDARDITQTALVKAFEKLPSYDSQYRFFSWIYRILINESLNHRKRGWRETDQPPEQRAGSASGPLERLEARELRERVLVALMQLTVEHRLVIVLRHYLELSYQEMSELLGIPDKTVKSRLFAARRRLGVLLEDGAES